MQYLTRIISVISSLSFGQLVYDFGCSPSCSCYANAVKQFYIFKSATQDGRQFFSNSGSLCLLVLWSIFGTVNQNSENHGVTKYQVYGMLIGPVHLCSGSSSCLDLLASTSGLNSIADWILVCAADCKILRQQSLPPIFLTTWKWISAKRLHISHLFLATNTIKMHRGDALALC